MRQVALRGKSEQSTAVQTAARTDHKDVQKGGDRVGDDADPSLGGERCDFKTALQHHIGNLEAGRAADSAWQHSGS